MKGNYDNLNYNKCMSILTEMFFMTDKTYCL